MFKENLLKNKKYIDQNHEELVNLYRNKYILVYEEQVVGSYDSYGAAAVDGIINFGTEAGFIVSYMSEVPLVNFVATALL